MMDKDLIIKKVPLKDLIHSLIKVYNEGAVYVDIIGKSDDVRDYIGIIVYGQNYDQVEEEDSNKEFDEKDINKLI